VGRNQLRSARSRLEPDIKSHDGEIGYAVVNWIHGHQERTKGSKSRTILQHLSLMLFIPCITHYKRPTVLTDCTTPLFYVLAPTHFGNILPSSGSLLDHPELHEIQIRRVVYRVYIYIYIYIYNVWLRGLCAGLSWFHTWNSG
jgi:hypothetical protein